MNDTLTSSPEREPLPRPFLRTVILAQTVSCLFVMLVFFTAGPFLAIALFLFPWVTLISGSYYMQGILNHSHLQQPPPTLKDIRKLHRQLIFCYMFTPVIGLSRYRAESKMIGYQCRWHESYHKEEDGRAVRYMPGGPLNWADYFYTRFDAETARWKERMNAHQGELTEEWRRK